MEGHTAITGIAVVGLAALLCGLIMTRLHQPAIVGYILAGVLLGPTAFGIVTNLEQIRLLADIGILMLLFLLGLELPIREFMNVWRTALLVLAGQILGFLAITFALSDFMGWDARFAAFLAFAATLSSTAVAIKMIEEVGESETVTGRISVAVLIAQDLAVVPMILFASNVGGNGFTVTSAAKLIAAGSFFTLLVIYFSQGRRFRFTLAEWIANHRELRPVAVLALCLVAASLSGVFGFSAAYGAFLAGLILGNSVGSARLVEAARPIEGLLMMIFFLSIGLLIDLHFIRANLGEVFMWLVGATVIKTALNTGILRLLKRPWPQAFLSGVLLGQIGEFSFLLAAVGARAGIFPPEKEQLIIAVIALSLLISPIWLITARRLHAITARRRTTLSGLLNYLYGSETRWIMNMINRGKKSFRSRLAKTDDKKEGSE